MSEVSEKRNFTAIKDRLIEEDTRRRNGDFYTPAVWAGEAHKMLDEHLGENWREEYVVWDCACGTGNLTRDYTFNELYLSTLYEDDVQTVEEMGYHTGGEGDVFQFDFLNDPLPGQEDIIDHMEGNTSPIPKGLQEVLEEGKKVVFLINPPFGTSAAGSGKGSNKEGVSFTEVKDRMDLGRAGNQMYAQFIWRISDIVERYDLDDACLAFYSTPLFMTSSTYEKFRDYFYDRWTFEDGFLFRADEFNGTSKEWGCSFTLWREGKEGDHIFDLTVKERGEMGIVKDQRKKRFYYPDVRAKTWAKAPRGMWWGKGEYRPHLSSAINVSQRTTYKSSEDSLGYLASVGNAVRGDTFFVSGVYSNGSGIEVFDENFRQCVALFTARRAIRSNWINQKDEFCVPNEDHPDYEQWVNDSTVYSLFNPKSLQSSLRDIEYKDEKRDIANEFFWMSPTKMKELADEYGFIELYNDTEQFPEGRYVYKQLEDLELSEDAQQLLDQAKELTQRAMSLREQAHRDQPEMHLQAWDAGWYQIRKGILEEYFPEEYGQFVEEYREFEERMREGVYEFGFLKD